MIFSSSTSCFRRLALDPERLLLILLLRILGERGVGLAKALAVVLAVLVGRLVLLLAVGLLHDHDHAGGALRLGRGAQLGARGDEDEGHVVVLAQHGEVADDVLGGDVAGDDDDAGEGGVAGGGGGGFAECLDDFLDTALEGVVLGSYIEQY